MSARTATAPTQPVSHSHGPGAICASRRRGHLYQSPAASTVQNDGMREQGRSQMLYLQIAESIATPIRAGTLTRGERIPSVRELARRHRVSLGTVMQAYRMLEDSRLIEARPRSGYFVAARPAETARARAIEPAGQFDGRGRELARGARDAPGARSGLRLVRRRVPELRPVLAGACAPRREPCRTAPSGDVDPIHDRLRRRSLAPRHRAPRAAHGLPARCARCRRDEQLPGVDHAVPALGDPARRRGRARIAHAVQLSRDPRESAPARAGDTDASAHRAFARRVAARLRHATGQGRAGGSYAFESGRRDHAAGRSAPPRADGGRAPRAADRRCALQRHGRAATSSAARCARSTPAGT